MDKYIVEKLRHHVEELNELAIMERLEIRDFRADRRDELSFADASFDDSGWKILHKGESWGGRDAVVWLRNSVQLPERFLGQCLELHLEPGPKEGLEQAAESLLYIDGREVHGLDNWHADVRLSEKTAKKREFHIALRCWAGLIPEGCVRRLGNMELRRIHNETRQLYYICRVLLEAAQQLDETDWNRYTLLQTVDEAFKEIDYFHVGEKAFYDSIERALTLVQRKQQTFPVPETGKPVVSVCGHSHIDMAWLWRICHTKEKAVRSFSTVLTLMEQYPAYRFSQSSPFIYETVREKYPGLYEKIREKIVQGRWEITGGMWVEPDTNLTGGESLVRQILLGKTYMRQEFGVDCKVLWLPDVFGYCAALPQLLKKSGIDFFWTNKMSWNQYNRFPYDTFLWRGLDGSEVLTQLGTCPEEGVTWGSTYNGVIAPWEVKGVWDNYRQKDINRNLLMPFGWGDGGGGPTREMLEAYPVMENLPGIPKVKMCTCESYAEELLENLKDRQLPVWDGEMYFEYHRGTYTSQGFIKRANRKTEYVLHDAELLSVLADGHTNQKQYPKEMLTDCWKKLCVNQFHDILPGSAIHEVYEDARRDYREIYEKGQEMIEKACRRIAGESKAAGNGVTVFNTLSWKRASVLALPEEYMGKTLLANGKKALCQTVPTLSGKRQLIYMPEIPALGYAVFALTETADEKTKDAIPEGKVLDTPFYRVRFNEAGQIEELYDKQAERQVLRKGCLGNVLVAMEDKPHQFDAWNIEIYAFEKTAVITELQEFQITAQGPIETLVRLQYRYHASSITQLIAFSHVDRMIRFDTVCDWQERDTLLKVCFDVEVRSKKAVFDVQFGNIERPTHSNTGWDYAQFEVCMHKWFDLSEDDYGVAVLNDCKYGCDVKDSLLRLTLLKSAAYPDKEADRGEHRFTYALLPHKGGWKEGNVARLAYELNLPLRMTGCELAAGQKEERVFSLAQTDAVNVIIETVKMAEDGSGVIFRLYEYMCRRGKVSVSFGRKIKSLAECDLLENPLKEPEYDDNSASLYFTPYEIKTIKVTFI